jgi:cytochrome c oxidase subunit 3
MESKHDQYYVPDHSFRPLIGCLALLFLALGLVQWLHEEESALYFLGVGAIILCWMFIGWFKDVIHESLSGYYSAQMNRTFRLGMLWFIFSEVWFFGAFFGALFYARMLALPMLGGLDGFRVSTHDFLYPHFVARWPLLENPNPALFPAAHDVVHAWGLPIVNTLLLLLSGLTITIAHHALLKKRIVKTSFFLLLTILLGIGFLVCQYLEYSHALEHLKLTLHSGIYGSTFYFLTGFHGLHVTIGTVMLSCILIRTACGHFNHDNHFAFEATAWYWHFVDVVWLFLFVFVYCL